MAERDFYADDAKRAVKEAVRSVEARTSAEIVVAVHHRAGEYRDVDLLVGFTLALAVLVFMLFAPPEFPDWTFAPAVLLAFVAGAATSSQASPLRRLLAGARRRRRAVAEEARAAFVRLGVSRTRGRSGVLVFVSTYDRAADVVADLGVNAPALAAARAALDAAAARLDFPVFVGAVRAMAEPLAAAMPRASDDVNELPDEVDAA